MYLHVISFIIRELFKEFPGAGSLIAFDPVTQKNNGPHMDMYETFDKPFRDYRCNRLGGCEKFKAARPINNGSGYEPLKGGNCTHSERLTIAI